MGGPGWGGGNLPSRPGGDLLFPAGSEEPDPQPAQAPLAISRSSYSTFSSGCHVAGARSASPPMISVIYFYGTCLSVDVALLTNVLTNVSEWSTFGPLRPLLPPPASWRCGPSTAPAARQGRERQSSLRGGRNKMGGRSPFHPPPPPLPPAPLALVRVGQASALSGRLCAAGGIAGTGGVRACLSLRPTFLCCRLEHDMQGGEWGRGGGGGCLRGFEEGEQGREGGGGVAAAR